MTHEGLREKLLSGLDLDMVTPMQEVAGERAIELNALPVDERTPELQAWVGQLTAAAHSAASHANLELLKI